MGCTCRCSYGRAQVFQRVGGGSYASPSALYGEMSEKRASISFGEMRGDLNENP